MQARKKVFSLVHIKAGELVSGHHCSLHFLGGNWILKADTLPPKNLFLKDRWQPFPDQAEFKTKDLKAAVAFRPYATPEAEKVFERILARPMSVPRLPPLSNLDPHQIEGIKWILKRSRTYLAHAPGAGKTAQAIVASAAIKHYGQVLFIVPPQLTVNWAREIEKFSVPLIGLKTVAIVGTTAYRKSVSWRSHYIIVPDSMLTKDWVYDTLQQLPFKFIAVDEASRFKEPNSQRSIALYGGFTRRRTFRGLVRKAPYVTFLDGSPMPSRPMELWAPAYAMDPESIGFMSQQDFGFRYCGARINSFGQWEFKGSSREEELKSLLQKDFMHVVGEERLNHPERRRSMLFMNEDVRTPAVKNWEKKHLKTLKEGVSAITEGWSQGELAQVRQELGIAKIDWIYSYVAERIVDKKEQILLFVWHRDVALSLFQLFNARFKPGTAALVIGGTDADTREQTFTRFQAGRCRIIIGNIQAMGRGHNLQKANRVVFGEFSWTDELNKQCEKRASRRGSEEDFVRCEYIVAPGSIDEVVLNAIFTKEKRVKKVIG